jgi:hypothetical protein
MRDIVDLRRVFKALTGHAPFPWQEVITDFLAESLI